jgi:menaquinone-9 beta-reductase
MANVRLGPGWDADVAVVGGGPAGAAAAVHLARRGFEVVLLDQQRFPRDKVCGDFVGPVAIAELQQLGVSEYPDYGRSNVVRRAGVHLEGRLLLEQPLPDVGPLPPTGRVVPRRQLDAWVVQAAVRSGVRLLERHRFRSYAVDRDGVSLELETAAGTRRLRARMLVGADGSTSRVGRVLRGDGTRRADRIIALRAYVEGVQGPPDRADLYFGARSFPGYCWLFPTGPSSANLGIGMMLDTLPPVEEHLRSLLQHHVDADPGLRERLRAGRLVGRIAGWPLATFDPHLVVTGDRVLLCGDAAGLINPLNGEGIQYALVSGRWAASAIAEAAPAGFSRRALGVYRDCLMRDIGYDMVFSRAVVHLIRNRALTPVFLQALGVIVARASVDPGYAALTGGLLAGLVPARDVVSGSVIAGTAVEGAATAATICVGQIRGGPTAWGASGVEAARLGFCLAHDAARRPLEVASWGTAAVRELTALAVATAATRRARPCT